MVETLTSNSLENWDYGAYVDYVDDKLVDWKQHHYGTHYARLRSFKDKCDP